MSNNSIRCTFPKTGPQLKNISSWSEKLTKIWACIWAKNWAVNQKTLTVRRAKRTKILGSAVYVACMLVFLTLNMSRSFWGHLVHFFENWAVTQKQLIVERNGRKYALLETMFSIVNSALCYCTAELVVMRVSVRQSSVKPLFSESITQINAKFSGKVPFHHISRPFFEICIFDFLWFYDFMIFYVCVNMVPLIWEKKLQTTYCLKVHNRFASKIHAYSWEGSLPKTYKELWNFKFLIVSNFFLFFVFFFCFDV